MSQIFCQFKLALPPNSQCSCLDSWINSSELIPSISLLNESPLALASIYSTFVLILTRVCNVWYMNPCIIMYNCLIWRLIICIITILCSGLENVQIVCSMSSRTAMGRHKLSSRFTSIVRIACVDIPEREQLQAIYATYLRPILHRQLAKHPVWSSSSKIHALSGSMLEIFDRTRTTFSQVLALAHCFHIQQVLLDY